MHLTLYTSLGVVKHILVLLTQWVDTTCTGLIPFLRIQSIQRFPHTSQYILTLCDWPQGRRREEKEENSSTVRKVEQQRIQDGSDFCFCFFSHKVLLAICLQCITSCCCCWFCAATFVNSVMLDSFHQLVFLSFPCAMYQFNGDILMTLYLFFKE